MKNEDGKQQALKNPFDTAFKEGMKHLPVARDFFKRYLPADLKRVIDLSSLRSQSASFIDEKFKQSHSDVVYSVETRRGRGYVYLLVEQQRSGLDKQFLLRLYGYVLRIIEQHIKEGHRYFPLVVPFVYYNGENHPKVDVMDFWSHFRDPQLARQLMTQPPRLVDAQRLSDEMPPDSWASLMELLLKHMRGKQDFLDCIHYLVKSGNLARIYKEGGRYYILAMLQLALREATISNKTTLGKALQGVLPELGEEVMGLLQQERQEGWQEGRKEAMGLLQQERQEGWQEGRKEAMGLLQQERQEGWQEGRQEGQEKIAFRMLGKGYDFKTVADLTGLSLKKLHALKTVVQ